MLCEPFQESELKRHASIALLAMSKNARQETPQRSRKVEEYIRLAEKRLSHFPNLSLTCLTLEVCQHHRKVGPQREAYSAKDMCSTGCKRESVAATACDHISVNKEETSTGKEYKDQRGRILNGIVVNLHVYMTTLSWSTLKGQARRVTRSHLADEVKK